MSDANTQPPVTLNGSVTLGAVNIQDLNNNVAVVSTAPTDAENNTSSRLATFARLAGYNGVTWDRIRSGFISAVSNFTGFLNVLPYARYVASPPTLIDGQGYVLQLDANGNLRVTLATGVAGEDLTNGVLKTEQRFSYSYIAAGQATTTIKSGSGFLHAIVFWAAATATNVTTIYDNTAGSGTIIGLPAATTATIPVCIPVNSSFGTGLTVVTGTANGSPMTFVYR